MGVQGLLQLLKSIQRPSHIKDFKGLTLGVDAYCWLHPGTIPCAVALATGKETTRYVDYVMHRVRMLVHYGITPYLIFDGNYLPSKAGTELKRAESRAQAKRKGLDFLKLGQTSNAHNELQKAIDVTPEMARDLIDELKKTGVEYVVAPYEADAQLAYLERKGIIQGIISEDSDLLVFGVKRLITKLDKFGECVEIRRDDFTACRSVSFVGWTDEMFRRMAILTGCDYIEGIPQIGLKTAHNLVRRHKDLDKILKAIQYEGKKRVPKGYAENFKKAEFTFLHQWVFCPETQMLVMSNDWAQETRTEDISFIGEDLPVETAIGIARGDLHPMTKLPLKGRRLAARAILQSTPSKTVNRTQNILQTPSDAKSHKKPIDSFFKPKRTPLAELDPNCFTPSPSQQDVLRRNHGSVVSTPVDENGALASARSSIAIQSTSRSTGSLRPTRDGIGLPIGANSVPHLSKRPRLCDDSPPKERSKGIKNIQGLQSKFFGQKSLDQSPSLKRQMRHKNDASVLSVADAIQGDIRSSKCPKSASFSLTDLSDSDISTPTKLEIFQDSKQTPSEPKLFREPPLDASQSSISSLSTSTSTLSSASTQATTTSLDESSIVSDEQCVSMACNEIEDLKANFTFSAPSVHDIPKSRTPNPNKQQLFQRESALRRLGRQAIQRSQSLPSLKAPSKLRASARFGESVEAEVGLKQTQGVLVENEPTHASRIKSFIEEPSISAISQGSEDMIVPNSEDDISDEVEEPEGEAEATLMRSKVNLGQFMFKG